MTEPITDRKLAEVKPAIKILLKTTPKDSNLAAHYTLRNHLEIATQMIARIEQDAKRIAELEGSLEHIYEYSCES